MLCTSAGSKRSNREILTFLFRKSSRFMFMKLQPVLKCSKLVGIRQMVTRNPVHKYLYEDSKNLLDVIFIKNNVTIQNKNTSFF